MTTEQKKNKKKKIAKAKQQAARTAIGFFFGDLVSSNFFGKYRVTVFLIICMFMAYITFKYECQTQMETIAKLETELSIVKSESIREQSTYKSRTRESAMKHLIDSMRLALKPQEQPPFILKYETKK